jgi:hypothetical protein
MPNAKYMVYLWKTTRTFEELPMTEVEYKKWLEANRTYSDKHPVDLCKDTPVVVDRYIEYDNFIIKEVSTNKRVR